DHPFQRLKFRYIFVLLLPGVESRKTRLSPKFTNRPRHVGMGLHKKPMSFKRCFVMRILKKGF
ncbi:MAG: hypothetical protein ACPIC3_08015, partial [Candidatus Puniceispirillaceae bacterium]